MRARWSVTALLLLAAAPVLFAQDAAKPAAKEEKPAAAAKEKTAKPPAVPVAAPAPKTLEQAMARLARVRVSVAFKETPFADAVDWIRKASGMNVMVSPVLHAQGIDGIRPLTMTLSNVSLRQVAELVARFSGSRFKLEDGILQFTTPKDARGKPYLRIYAIGELTMKIRNFPGPDLNLRPAGADFEDEAESDADHAWSDPQRIVDMIQRTCGEETWTDADVSISADENKLIVRQYAEVHREIARLVTMLRGAR